MNAKDAIRSSANLGALVIKTYMSDLDDADLMRRPGEGCNHLAWQVACRVRRLAHGSAHCRASMSKRARVTR